jgi:hypothetical protein
MVTTPESVIAAAGNLADIGSSLQETTAAAAGPTTGVAAAAADEVSVAISELFGGYGQEFQALSAEAAAFHNEFVNLLAGGAAAYLGADIANAAQTLLNAVDAPPRLFSAAVSADAYQQLFADTATNLQSLYNTTAAHPFPLLNQIAANQQRYWQQIAAGLPVELANLPVTIQAGVQGLLAFNPASIQQFFTTQIGFAQTYAMSLNSAVTGLAAGFPGFEDGLRVAYQTFLAGNYPGAVQELGQAVANLYITGFDVTGVTANVDLTNLTLTLSANASPLGPLAYLLTADGVPAQDAQYLTNLLPAGSVPRQMSQNLTNVLTALTNPTISASVSVSLSNPQPQFNAYFGLPLSLAYASLGPPVVTLDAVATSATAVQQALATGNGVAAVGALFDAPAVVADNFLNGTTILDVTIPVPTGLPAPLPNTVSIVLHLPFDGILVPPHHITATLDVPGFTITLPPPLPPVVIPDLTATETIGGTPFSGIVPMLVDYLPEQLAAAITPAG